MKKALAASLLLASTLALAQTPYKDDTTYRGLGGKDGIERIIDTFFPIVLADPRIKDTFADFDIKQVKVRLVEQLCEFAGGPCKYTGKYRDRTMDGVGTVRDMQTVHQDLQITDAQFNALAEDLQLAMERNDVPNHIANKLLAKLAPMRRDIVTK
ncbi:group I truncated hemoglobin [Massilia endophytica]|uniref:group I truncated hemoglobin n=1 Tax=Massilia endophytica TaxID=2899220 RepID=UPI001E48E882|nr:group 1 truncated hemoglobin [Massilia endophytica]UGQ46452.1 group 1 truncated hemoglobin [Massilia endophytica]